MNSLTPEDILRALRNVVDPELSRDLVSLAGQSRLRKDMG